jgi:hypothetical protein
MPLVGLRFSPALAGGDASGLDQVDRDLSRDLSVPPAAAGGYAFDSNGNSVNRSVLLIGNDRPGSLA